MARYRKIDPRIWNDAKFRELSNDGKLAFLFTLTHPHMTALGAMRATIPGLAAEIGWSTKAFAEAFGEALRKGMARHDERASFMWLPRFLKYNGPESPNVVKAWESSLDLLPECPLKAELIQEVKAFAEGLTEGFAKALPQAFAKGMPYQEQEQEQEQEQKQEQERERDAAAPVPRAPAARRGKPRKSERSRRVPADFEPDRERPVRLLPDIDLDREIEKFKRWEFKTPRSDWPATWANWIDSCVENGRYARLVGKAGQNVFVLKTADELEAEERARATG
jgi:hypothetical protein